MKQKMGRKNHDRPLQSQCHETF